MSLLAALGQMSQKHEETFLNLTAGLSEEDQSPPALDMPVADDEPSPAAGPDTPLQRDTPPVVDPVPPEAGADAPLDEEAPQVDPAPPEQDVPLSGDPVPPAAGADAPSAQDAAPVGSEPPVEPDVPPAVVLPEPLEGPLTGDPGQEAAPQVPPSPPDGLPARSGAISLTSDERSVAFADAAVYGSVVDGGPAQDMIDGKYPKPSVTSQREIEQFNRLRMSGLDLKRPGNWPDFMTFPTEAELLALRQENVTPDMIRDFEKRKQEQADQMEIRAREINTWIFDWGTMALNENAQMSRARNRDAAIRRRATGPDGRVQGMNDVDASDVTDEELYGDRHYGIRFTLLLNRDPESINRLRSAPVSAWGHDQLRTMDGGHLQVKGDEIIVRKSSMEAAKLLVMEAQARGWETIRVSGHNEFCAAVKRAAKEAGLGAIIHRRGPLGLGPFGRPEVVMPAIPRVQQLNQTGTGGPEREQRAAAAPEADREAAARLLESAPGKPVRLKDPLRPEADLGPERQADKEAAARLLEPGPGKPVRVKDPLRPLADPGPDLQADVVGPEPR
jgi:hypothetical protein